MITNLRETQGFIDATRSSGQDDEQILSRLLNSSMIDPRAKQVFEEQKKQGQSATQLLDFYKQVNSQPLKTAQDFEIPGVLGKVGRFIGAEKLGRRLASEIVKITDRDTFTALDNAVKQGYLSREEVETIKTSGVSTNEALGGAALLAAAAFLPAARGLTRLAGTGAVFGGAGALEESGEFGDIPRGAAFGAVAAPVAVGALSGVGMLGKFLFRTLPRNLLGALSGKGTATFETALQRPLAAKEGLKLTDKTASEIAKESRNAFFKLSDEVSDAYGKSLEQIEKAYRKTSLVPKIGRGAVYQNQAGETIKLTLQGVKSKLTQTLKDFQVFVDPKTLKISTANSAILRREAGDIQQIFDIVQNWKDFSPTGLNRLATKVGGFRRSGASFDKLNAIVTATKKSIREYLGERVPEVKVLNQEFFKRSQFLDSISDILGVKSKVGGDKELRRVFGKIATLFDKNKELARLTIQEFEEQAGVDILGREAGRRLGQPITVSSASFGGLINTIFQTVFDPITRGIPVTAASIQTIKSAISKNANNLAPQVVKDLNNLVEIAERLAKQSGRIAGFDVVKEISK